MRKPKDDQLLIASLEKRGYRITKNPPRERATAKLDVRVKPGGILRLGMTSDTHLNSRKQQITALTDFYRYADGRGVAEYLHAGDLGDGLHVHRDAVYEQFHHGFDAQIDYCVRAYPRSQNGPTRFIEGNHDLWYYGNSGASFGRALAERRPDLKYLGDYAAWVEVGGLRIYIAHGAKGGGAYAKSYKPQKLIEQMQVEERQQTQLAFFGHWHSDEYTGRYQGVFTHSLPCFQAQTRFIKTLGRTPVIGGLVLEIEFTRDMKVWNVRQDWRYYEAVVGDYPGGERDAA